MILGEHSKSSTNGGYYYFSFRSMYLIKLVIMAASGKKMGRWGKEWKGDLHFAIFIFL